MAQREVSPNVYGIETEYSVLITPNEHTIRELVGVCHSVDVKLGLYQEPKQRGSIEIDEGDYTDAFEELGIIRNEIGMLTNGGRFYVDPSGPEYDTPETRTAEEAVLRMFDGDKIMHAVFHRLCETGVIRGYQLNRKIVDHNRTSRGIHLNTYTNYEDDGEEKGMPGPDVIAILSTLNVVKGSLFGSGGLLLNDEGETEYHHSPRLSITTDEWDYYGNYSQRPLVRVPFKPDGENHHGRIETVTSDALNFGWPLRASMVLTNAVVGLIA